MCFKVIKKDPLNAKNRFNLLIKSAEKRNISVEFNLDHYRSLLLMGCVYCGSDLKKEKGYSIDRHDNHRGYVTDNVAPCCKVCNRAKGTMANEEFLDWVIKAYEHQSKMLEQFKNIEYDEKYLKKKFKILKNGSSYKNSKTVIREGVR